MGPLANRLALFNQKMGALNAKTDLGTLLLVLHARVSDVFKISRNLGMESPIVKGHTAFDVEITLIITTAMGIAHDQGVDVPVIMEQLFKQNDLLLQRKAEQEKKAGDAAKLGKELNAKPVPTEGRVLAPDSDTDYDLDLEKSESI